MKKLLVSDFDDTLYVNEEEIKVNLDKIDEFRKKGNLFVVASGRSYVSFKEIIKIHNIKFDYLMLSHGTLIYDKNMNLIKKYTINEEIVKDILSFIDKIKSYSIYLFNSISLNEPNNYEDVTKMSIEFNTVEEAKEIERLVNENFGNYVKVYQINHKRHYIEMITKEANKSNAIKYLINYIDISNKDVYTVGNAINDLEMIKDFNGYAMNHSEEIVLNNVSKRCNSVHELIEKINGGEYGTN